MQVAVFVNPKPWLRLVLPLKAFSPSLNCTPWHTKDAQRMRCMKSFWFQHRPLRICFWTRQKLAQWFSDRLFLGISFAVSEDLQKSCHFANGSSVQLWLMKASASPSRVRRASFPSLRLARLEFQLQAMTHLPSVTLLQLFPKKNNIIYPTRNINLENCRDVNWDTIYDVWCMIYDMIWDDMRWYDIRDTSVGPFQGGTFEHEMTMGNQWPRKHLGCTMKCWSCEVHERMST